jgi:hypothetical protein
MTSDELSRKLIERVEFMLTQYLPKPTCPTKQRAHRELMAEVRAKIAEGLAPGSGGVNINITV